MDNLETFESKAFHEKFLGTLVYELLRRAMYYTDFRLTSSAIKSIAYQFKTALKMDWFFPNNKWVEKFRSIYNLPDVNTDTLSIGYDEAKSTEMIHICRYLIPASMVTKMPRSIMEFVEGSAVSNQIPKVTKASEPLDKVKEVIKSTAVEVEKLGKTEVAADVENDCPLRVIKEKLAMNGVRIARKKIVSESTTIDYAPIDKIEIVENPIIFPKIEDSLPSPVCLVPDINSQKTKIILNDKSVVEILATVQPTLLPKAEPEVEIKSEKITQVNQYKKAKEEDGKLSTLRSESKTIKKLQTTKRNGILNRRLRTPIEALRCIKMLEEFALIKENFRLIGLIERLEKVIQKTI